MSYKRSWWAEKKKIIERKWLLFRSREWFGFGIQSIIMFVLTTMTFIMIIIMSLLLYNRYKMSSERTAVSNTQGMAESLVDRLDSDLLGVRKISNAVNYNIIQEFDISSQEFLNQFSLMYEANTETIESLALYDNNGEVIICEPVGEKKADFKVKDQEWFQSARKEIENIHFSTPHIQNLFEDGSYEYKKVISLSRSVDINNKEKSSSGVLLVDMKYSVIEDVLEYINDSSEEIYYYLCSMDGEMIYHPRQTEIERGLFTEKSSQAASYEDGVYEIGKESVVVKSMAYTGWKLVGVIPETAQTESLSKLRLYILTIILVLFMMLLIVNRIISANISKPIQSLALSVKNYEAGGKKEIYVGGSQEIKDLGYAVRKSYRRIEHLMLEIIEQQNERRKSEIDALQSQINPHFLYNTLESITWMVETKKNDEAVLMISELARLLRISLSRGRTVISIRDEIQHSRSYMNIQKVRYKERFSVRFEIDPQIEDYCIVKLIIQPLLENAIYYGVGSMDPDDGGEILVRGEKRDGDIFISVEDNGMGMKEEDVENILLDGSRSPKHGSGVGVKNVHSRIRLMFGEKYGLTVESELDEGTKVCIHIPAIPYSEENAQKIEKESYEQWGLKDE